MQLRETGKQRSQRIQMDYYRQFSGLALAKTVFALLAGVGAAAVVAHVANTGGGDLANPGPLAAGHAAFEEDCGSCHRDLTPIGRDALRQVSLLGITEERSVEHTYSACTECHLGGGHPIGDHFRAKMEDPWPLDDKNCVPCHIDHQGREQDLTKVADQLCVKCHGRLQDVCRAGQQEVQLGEDNRAIRAFTLEGHGYFPSLMSGDRGQIVFDHAQHLLPGQAAGGKETMLVGDLEPEWREHYRSAMERRRQTEGNRQPIADDQPVQLDCASCHEMSGLPSSASVGSALDAEVGRHMKPISFEQHCSACHAMNPAGRGEGTLPIPHAASWMELKQWVVAKFAAADRSPPRDHPLPVGAPAPSSAANADELATRWRNSSQIDDALKILKEQCRKCHSEDHVRDDDAILRAKAGGPLIPQRWLRRGLYDHAAHAAIDCKFCHVKAYAPGTPSAVGTDQNVVMIGGIETCVDCHRAVGTPTPAKLLDDDGESVKQVFGTQPTWASDRCTLCHRYHTVP